MLHLNNNKSNVKCFAHSMTVVPKVLLIALLMSGAAVRADDTTLPESAGYGATPTLPAPQEKIIPTVHIAPEKGWSENGTPIAAPGLEVRAYATDLAHPRMLHVLPNGDVLVAETSAPPKKGSGGIKAWFQKKIMKAAGAAVPSANRITLLRDIDENGNAKTRTVFIEGLHSPFGMALIGNDFYVANTDAILRFPYEPGATHITVPGVKVMDLPAGEINHHWTKDLIASQDGKRLYVTVGSNSNVGENGVDNEVGRAAIHEFDIASGKSRLFATGLRNPNGLAWEPKTGALWVAVNERDELGNDLVPDYMTSVRDGGFYGWPYSYYGQHVDKRVKPPKPELVASAIPPDYALGSHTAPLGLTFYLGSLLPEHYVHGAFIGLHGSWNRKPRSGYKVIFVDFENGRPVGQPQDILTGFVNGDGEALGRPVGVAVDKKGALLVADDVGKTVWRVTSLATAEANSTH